MNDFSEIENELKKLRPAQPSPVLFERIEEALDCSRPSVSDGSSRKIVAWRRFTETPYNWLGLGLAAAAVLILFVRINMDRRQNRSQPVALTTPAAANETRSTSPNEFIPAGLTQVVYRTRDEGLQFSNGYTQPVRRVRYQTHETMRWRNPATGASLRVSYPSEEVVLTPISGQ
jgi:hypothetical protein